MILQLQRHDNGWSYLLSQKTDDFNCVWLDRDGALVVKLYEEGAGKWWKLTIEEEE